jgi:hypothetical protein
MTPRSFENGTAQAIAIRSLERAGFKVERAQPAAGKACAPIDKWKVRGKVYDVHALIRCANEVRLERGEEPLISPKACEDRMRRLTQSPAPSSSASDGRRVCFTDRDLRCFAALFNARGGVVSRELVQLAASYGVPEDGGPLDRQIDLCIMFLRRKLWATRIRVINHDTRGCALARLPADAPLYRADGEGGMISQHINPAVVSALRDIVVSADTAFACRLPAAHDSARGARIG